MAKRNRMKRKSDYLSMRLRGQRTDGRRMTKTGLANAVEQTLSTGETPEGWELTLTWKNSPTGSEHSDDLEETLRASRSSWGTLVKKLAAQIRAMRSAR